MVAVFVSVVTAFLMLKSEGSVFHSSWHYVCHFSVMVMGGMAYMHKGMNNRPFWDMVLLAVSFVAYFAIMAIGKGQADWRYYAQILALLPLHSFCWFAYKVCSYGWCDKVFVSRVFRWPFVVVSSLTLEIYIVQFHIISARFNSMFPLSLIIVFALICLAAYLLRVAVNIFIQFMGRENWRWSDVMHL
ncbi:MAG: hypothetical protein NC344_05470 [Bacteroidales bacterium]|nr:hypothetical protein [Bacteroidales bacterium]MCM1206298.1 hypothetical protein [Bacillota bacterium]